MKIALALSGGGARGFAHIGVIKALLEDGFVIERISGASAGAVVGALHAHGYTPEEILDIFGRAGIRSVLSLSTRLTGFLHHGRVEKFLQQCLPHNSFEALKVPLTLNATDIQAGETVYFDSGPLVRPLLAASCIPVLFEPVRLGDRLLVDGGILNNLPVEPLLDSGLFVVGVHTNPCGTTLPLINMRTVMERSLLLAIQTNVRERARRCDFFIEPPELCRYTTLDASKSREIFAIGHTHARQVMPQLRCAFLARMAS